MIRLFQCTVVVLMVVGVGRTAEPEVTALDQRVAEAMKAFEVPGAAVVIVQRDKVIYVKGFGVRDASRKDPVTADTVFAIASCTKAFTATMVGLLVADGKMNWDDPVRKHVEWFKLVDPVADREVTIRDLLCHRTGMPRHDLLWDAQPNSPEEYIRAYGLAKPSTSFRSTWEYANIPFTTAGLATGYAAKSDWATLVQQRLFEPLGMKTARCSAKEALANPDHATPHNRFPDGKIMPVVRGNVDSVRAAGSINASPRDMGQWLRFQLANGVLDGKRLIPEAILKETRTPQMVVRQEGRWKIFFPEHTTNFVSYGLGWFVSDYRGMKAVSHGGTLDGFRTQTMLLPDQQLGVVVCGNLTPSTFPEALTKTLLDHLLGLSDQKWNDFYTRQDAKTESDRLAALRLRESQRQKDTKPSHDWPAYHGVYTHPAYGRLEVIPHESAAGLMLKWGKWTVQLAHYHYDTFTGTITAPPELAIQNQRGYFDVQFQTTNKGTIGSVRFLDQDFQRVTAPTKK